MKAVVIFDSYFGNTEKIAQAIGEGLGENAGVQVLRVSAVQPDDLAGADLLVVGSATRGFSASPGVRNYLKSLPAGRLDGVRVAAFDTRIPKAQIEKNGFLNFMVKLFGYAAEPIARQLKARGGELLAPAEGFFVEDSEGPLSEGELERAAAWGKHLLAG